MTTWTDELELRARAFAARWLSRPRLDVPLTVALLLLACIGLATLHSASGGNLSLVTGQALRFGLGFGVMIALSRISPLVLRSWSPYFFAITILLLMTCLVLGEGRGAHRWLDLKVLRFQPSEFAKLAMPMMIAWLFADRALPPSWRSLGIAGALTALPFALIAKQPDLGTALLVGASGAFAIFLAGLAWWRIGLIVGLGGACLPIAWRFMHEYQKNRVRMFMDPESDPLGNGWHIIQSKIAVGSGGLTGKGFGMSTQAKLDFLPEHTTDFIFAVFSEEHGLIGVALVVLLYLFIVGRGLYIAANARETYSRLLAGSLSMAFFVYVMVNGGMVAGLLPVVGVPMPLISYGGTSAVSLLAGFGVLQSIHAHRRR